MCYNDTYKEKKYECDEDFKEIKKGYRESIS